VAAPEFASLLTVLARQVDIKVVDRADSYRGAVKILGSSDGRLLASVSGSHDYRVAVEVEFDGDFIYASCDCRDFADHLRICEHIWATVALAFERGLLSDVLLLVRPQLIPDEDLDPEDVERSLAAPIGASGVSPAAPKASNSELRRLAEAVRSDDSSIVPPARKKPAERDIVYAFNPDQTPAPCVEVLVRSRHKRTGAVLEPKPWRPRPSEIAALPPEDRELVGLICSIARKYSESGLSDAALLATADCTRAVAVWLLPKLCATGRCHLKGVGRTEAAPLVWDGEELWRPRLAVTRDEAQGEYVLRFGFRRGDETAPFARFRFMTLDGIVVHDSRVGLASVGSGYGLVRAFTHLKSDELRAKFAEAEQVVRALAPLTEPDVVEWPADLALHDASTAPIARAVFRSPTDDETSRHYDLRGALAVDLQFRYGSTVVDAHDPTAPVVIIDWEGKGRIARNRTAEAKAAATLARHGVTPAAESGYRFSFTRSHDPPRTLHRIRESAASAVAVELSEEGFEVELRGRPMRRATDWRLSATTRVDWFELEAAADFGGVSAPLPRLLAALREGKKTFELSDGSVGVIPDDAATTLAPFARFGKVEGNVIRFRPTQAALLDALLEGRDVACDAGVRAARERLQSFRKIEPVDPPAAFRGELRPYQREGLAWMAALGELGFGGCLADDMGLGKTVQVLAYLVGRPRGKPSLVVAPRSLIFNWKAEAARFAPELRVLDFSVADRKKEAERFAGHDLVLTTYGVLRREAPFLKDMDFDVVVLDEAQTIKNATTASAKAARLLNAGRRLALSGTPVENRLADLWSLFEFLNPGLLGASSAFESFAAKKEPAALELLARAVRPFLLRRTKGQVLKDLPPKTEQTLWVELEGEQRKLYDELRDHYRALLLKVDDDRLRTQQFMVLEALLRLRQAACHPGLIDPLRAGDDAAKIDALLPQLAEVVEEGHKALVFSQFTGLLDLVETRLNSEGLVYTRLDGKTKDRAKRVERFREPDCGVFLISLKAGGLGLNLVEAEYVFILDPWWNPAAEAQAVDRAHRIGQKNAVFAYRLVAKGTVEERVVELQRQKKDLADAIVRADEGLVGAITRDDLKLLLS
jgi:superfamily II DNA or RNA helicase